MSNIFQSVQGEKIRHNNFPLSHENLLTGRIGHLIPVQCDEVVPGDIFRQTNAFLMRFSPLSAPAMVRFNVHFHTFYVPFRIITPETSRESTYERFIKSIGKHSSEVPDLPYLYGDVTNVPGTNPFSVGQLGDYLGYPTNLSSAEIKPSLRLSALPFLAYQRIYQDFYRRDQIEKEAVYPSNLGAIDIEFDAIQNTDDDFGQLSENQREATLRDLFTLQVRNYERDYFTSALPEPQFGDEVTVGDASINWVGNDNNNFFTDILTGATVYNYGNYPNSSGIYDARWSPNNTQTVGILSVSPSGNDVNNGVAYPISVSGTFDGEALAESMRVNPITINEFRLAMQLQGLKEKINRVGTRYLEIMEGIYGVRVPDARLQRPIYLGGYKTPVNVGSVMQTSESDKSKQGTLTGQMSAGGSNTLCKGNYMFVEHGYLMTIMSITPRTSYYGGIPRKFMKRYPEDFYLPQFDHLGEQPIYNLELFCPDDLVDGGTSPFNEETGEEGNPNNGIFGYTPRYSEYKSAFSSVHGEFRTTLDNWHVSRDFDRTPGLNPDFIKADPADFDRLFQFEDIENTSNEHFQCQIYFDIVAKRNMSKYSTPYTLY